MQVQKISRYGWRKDRNDPRDHIYNLNEYIFQGNQLPQEHDLESDMPPVYDQLQLGSCTANATAAIFQHMMMKEGVATAYDIPSRLFIYHEERRIGGYPLDQDTGAEVRDGVKVLATEGAPPESEWPYSDANPGPFQQEPPPNVFIDALKHEAVQYQKIIINSPGAPMRTAITNDLPIAFGFPVPAMFEDPSWNVSTTPLPLPAANTQFIGGHAVVVVGYDFSRKQFPIPAFKVRNSWNTNWGINGYFWMDYRWFDPFRQLADDLWVVMKTS